jgi:hypothetical protein
MQEVAAWLSLNVQLAPEKKPQVLDGSLFAFHCKKCGLRALLTYPILYHDMEKQLMIYLIPDGAEEEWSRVRTQLAGERMKEYQLRYVKTPEELAEKIREFDCGLDDRIVELFKPTVFSEPGQSAELQVGPLVFHGNGKPLPDGEPTYVVSRNRHGPVCGPKCRSQPLRGMPRQSRKRIASF